MKRTVFMSIATAIALTMVAPAAMAQTGTSIQPAAATASSFNAKAAADNFLQGNAAKYNLKSDLSDLSYITTVTTPAGSYVRYQQTVDGAPLFNHQVNVTLDKDGNTLLVVSDYVPNLSLEKISKKISENDAENAAKAHNKSKESFAMNSREFGYTVDNGVAIPVYKVIVNAAEDQGSYETMIHAGTGKVLKNRDLREKASGTGKVFIPNPVASQGSTAGLADNNNADSTALTNQLKPVTLQGLDGSGYLTGQYVTITEKTKKNLPYSASLAFNYTRSQNGFEAVQAYYTIDTVQRYIQSLGFTNINNRSIVVNPHGTTQDNSWYTPSTRDLTFGTGGVDDAEDSGVIAHEYGHSIQDNQVPGFGATEEGGAMGEGFGDFMGATYEDATDGGTFKACVAEWDSTSYSSTNPPCLRRLDNNKVYPADMAGEVHSDGEIWSQGEYDMAQAFGRDIATKIILQSHFSLTTSAGFKDGVAAIKAADQALYGGSHLSQINAIWAARGL